MVSVCFVGRFYTQSKCNSQMAAVQIESTFIIDRLLCRVLASLSESKNQSSSIESRFLLLYSQSTIQLLIATKGYTTIQQMTIPRLTKWRPNFDILMIQRLFLFWKKRPKFFSSPSRVSLKDFSYPLRVPERTYTTPHGVFLPLAGVDFWFKETFPDP